jgi:hypothetical protein
VELKLPKTTAGHHGLVRDFSNAVLKGRKPAAPGDEAMWSLEIINAIYLSSYTGEPVLLPVPRRKYADLVRKLRKAGPKAVHRPLKPSPVR